MIGWDKFECLPIGQSVGGLLSFSRSAELKVVVVPISSSFHFFYFDGHLCVTNFLLRLPYALAMDSSYFEPTKLSAKIPTAPTGWRYPSRALRHTTWCQQLLYITLVFR